MTSRWKNSLLAVALSAQPAVIPQKIPVPQFGPKSTPQDILRCERTIIYRGKSLPCDSPIANDGEGLRTLLLDSPEALESIHRYQANRRSLQNTAYFGILGLLVAALGPRFSSDPGTRNLMVGGGLAFTLGSFAFGKNKLRSNEVHLDQAIETYNRSHPDDPIELRR